MIMPMDFPGPGPAKPDSHLEVVLGNLSGGDSRLVQALLRVDLGARINVDAAVGSIDIEGRFLLEDVVRAIETLGYLVVSVEPRPRSTMKSSSYLIA